MKESPQEMYAIKVSFVRDGMLSYEAEARQMANEYGLALQALEDALPIGRQKKYAGKVNLVRGGILSYEAEARQMANEYGLALQALEDALLIGKQKETSRKLDVGGTK